jgi:hypothetical protein
LVEAAAAAAAAAVAAPTPTDVQQGKHGQADRHFRGLTAAVVFGFIEQPSLTTGCLDKAILAAAAAQQPERGSFTEQSHFLKPIQASAAL